MKISSKILGINFGILDNSKWGKISDGIAKRIHIWNRVQLSLKGVIVNKTLLFKLWYIDQICGTPKYTKREYTIFSWTEKNTTYQTPSSNLHFDEWARYFRHRGTIKLSKNKMDSKVIESQRCSLERFHAVSIELNSEL